MDDDPFTQEVLKHVKDIPQGKVSTYSMIAKLSGKNKGAREVGAILNLIDKENLGQIPWQRVINAEGEIAFNDPEMKATQRELLEKEGIIFKEDKVNLDRYLYNPHQSNLNSFMRQ